MAKEIERKFLVASEDWREAVVEVLPMQQFYLATAPDRSVRVRLRQGIAILTMKFGVKDRVREEFEYPIPMAEAEEMRAFAIGRVIKKVRHKVRHRNHIYEIDVFEGDYSGLVIAELETPDDVPDEDLPAWLGREVTGEAAYYNASMALRERPGDML
ncbi:adenylate cyclase [Mesorhizobium soli]|uniref:CYTH domain-containing protein n=1 Tax=Pseudaminobacter soli (ex Li et al. 2025) TaxID=1295366 RepID=UPI002475D97F|nr:CYTH domain-containing protein [Mesorhizobium soli]MDH6230603.1 adenylate cyclase [Mesorhizobium soli]